MMKNWLRYLLYALIFFIFVITFSSIYNYQHYLLERGGNAFSQYLVSTIAGFLFGLLLGFEHFLKELKKQGKWVFNLPRFLFIGIPSLFFGLYVYIYYSGIPFICFLSDLPVQVPIFTSFCQVLFGFMLATNFSRCTAQNEIR
jgi:membrane protease YdiL (CAAX protease family)